MVIWGRSGVDDDLRLQIPDLPRSDLHVIFLLKTDDAAGLLVYATTNTYLGAWEASPAANQLTPNPRTSTDKTRSTIPHQNATGTRRRAAGNGRLRVRCMTRSMSRSNNWLYVAAAPAHNAPPKSVEPTTFSAGSPRAATTIAAAVVTKSSAMIRGFVIRTKS